MCRSDVAPIVALPLAALLTEMGSVLASESGVDPGEILIGPVDFGVPMEERP